MTDRGDVHICSWSHDGASLRAWLRDAPDAPVIAATFDEIIQRLIGIAADLTGDLEPAIVFDSPEPGAPLVPVEREMVEISGNELAEAMLPPDAYFRGGVCEECGAPLGQRTRTKLSFKPAKPRDGYVVAVGKSMRAVYAEDLLTSFRIDASRWMECEVICDIASRRYLELPVAPDVHPVALRGAGAGGATCGRCGAKRASYWSSGSPVPTYVDRRDVSSEKGDWFVLQSGRFHSLLVQSAGWYAYLRGVDHTDLTACRVGVVAPDRVQS